MPVIRLLLLSVLAAAAACTGTTPLAPDGGIRDDGGHSGCVETVTCPADGQTCGAVVGTCGVVDCGLCRFDVEVLSERARLLDVDDAHGVAHVAWLEVLGPSSTDQRIAVATRVAGGGWHTRTLFPSWSGVGSTHFAVAGNAEGDVCGALFNDDALSVRCLSEGGAPVDEPIQGFGEVDAIDLVLHEGSPAVLVTGRYRTPLPAFELQVGTFLVRREASEWRVKHLEAAAQPSYDAALLSSPAGLWAFWRNAGSGALRAHHEGPTGALAEEVVDAEAGIPNGLDTVRARLDAHGRPALIYAGGRTVRHATRGADGNWTIEPVGGRDRETAFVEVGGVVHAVFHSASALHYAQRREGRWFSQMLSGACDSGRVAMFREGDRVRIIPSSDCRYESPLRILTPAEHFPVEVSEACDTIVSTLCRTSCACGSEGGDCCVFSESANTCSSAYGCDGNLRARFCGSVTMAPEQVLACRDAVLSPSLACAGPDGIEVPSACRGLWSDG